MTCQSVLTNRNGYLAERIDEVWGNRGKDRFRVAVVQYGTSATILTV